MFLVILLLITAVIDYKKSRIPNWCIAIGIIIGIFEKLQGDGIKGIVISLVQVLLVFLFFYPFYLLKGLGAGDIKLFMMLGCFMIKEELVKCLLITFLLATAKCLICMIRYKESRKRLLYFMGYIRKLCITRALDEYEWDKNNRNNIVRLAIPAFCSVLLLYGGII